MLDVLQGWGEAFTTSRKEVISINNPTAILLIKGLNDMHQKITRM